MTPVNPAVMLVESLYLEDTFDADDICIILMMSPECHLIADQTGLHGCTVLQMH